MAISSLFYAGDTDTVEWAQGSSRLGFQYAVHGPDDFKVTRVTTATRTVSVAPGLASGGGVVDYNDDDAAIELPNVTSGAQWFLVGILRTWQTTNASTLAYIEGSSTKQIPPRPMVPGDEDFHPLALVQITAGQTVPTQVADLRAIGSNSGTLVANDDLVRSYLDGVGTTIRIGSRRWLRTLEGGVPTWVDESEPITITTLTGTSATASQAQGWTRLSESKLVRDGKRRWLHYSTRRIGSAFRGDKDSGDITNQNLGAIHAQDRPGSGIAVVMSGRVRQYANRGAIAACSGYITSGGDIILNWVPPNFYVNGGGSGEGGHITLDAFWYVP